MTGARRLLMNLGGRRYADQCDGGDEDDHANDDDEDDGDLFCRDPLVVHRGQSTAALLSRR